MLLTIRLVMPLLAATVLAVAPTPPWTDLPLRTMTHSHIPGDPINVAFEGTRATILAAFGTIGLTEQCRLKLGYMALWVVGVPQAQQQFNFDLSDPGGTFSHTSSIFWHGPMIEMQFAF